MAKVFLDANKLIDLVFRDPEFKKGLTNQSVCISALSIHILCYAEKYKMPNEKIENLINEFEIIPLNNQILKSSIVGPTADLEDNIQLHSSAVSLCDFFLTSDKKLLKLKYFGKTRILASLPQ